jgi:hypothetical protein
MTKIWRYVLAHDNGLAPCVDNDLLTLCCCKPTIRKSAVIGDWVIGFMPARYGRGRVAWAGQVSSVRPMGAYCQDHPDRTDAIYRLVGSNPDGTEILQHAGGNHHQSLEAQTTDARGRNCLIFSPFWYFGAVGQELPTSLEGLGHYYIGQTTIRSTEERLGDLQGWLSRWSPGIHGVPRVHVELNTVPVHSNQPTYGSSSVSQ